MEDTNGHVLATMVAVEFGNRVAVIGDERTIVAAIDRGKAVAIVTGDGRATVAPGTRWVKRNGAQRFNLRGETGHGPRGGRRRYPQSIAAFYVDGDVTPCTFEDGAALLTAEADSHDAPTAVTGDSKRASKSTSKSTAPVTSTAGTADGVAALLASLPADALAALLATVAAQSVTVPAVVDPPAVVKSTSTRRKSTSTRRGTVAATTAGDAEMLLGLS